MADVNFDLIKGSELPHAVNLIHDEQFLVIQGGVTKQFGIDLMNELLVQASYIPGTFQDTDVVNGVLTINHGLNTDKVILFTKNALGEQQYVANKVLNNNTLEAYYPGGIEEGTHSFIILYWKAGSEFNENTKFKTIQIDNWDVATHITKNIPHGLDANKILTVKGYIVNDAGYPLRRTAIPGDFDPYFDTYMFIEWDDTNIIITRNADSGWTGLTSGYYAGRYYRSLGIRGKLHITYTD